MSKADITELVAEATGLTKKDTKAVIDEFLNQIAANMNSVGDKIQLTGFGTFEVRHRNERQAVNPSTKEKITVPATSYPAFKSGKALKDKVKGK
ncbi:MAG TPA: HU family DNA-binding protein [Trueperaceae bacterium]|nr:HU family DNA-binding protein [Trueperaceae bacterium]